MGGHLARIEEILLAGGWTVRRLGAGPLDLTAARDEFARAPGETVALIVMGDAGFFDHVALAMRAIPCERLLVVASVSAGAGPDRARDWLLSFGTLRAGDLVAVASADTSGRLIDALAGGLAGAAIDGETKTVTARSLGAHLVRVVPELFLHMSDSASTLVPPPSFTDTAPTQPSRRAQSPILLGEGRQDDHIDDLVGVILPSRFRVDRKLASGSFGTVYQARQLTVDRDVAIKVMHADFDPASEDGRLFLQEIQSVGKIDHPNVVRIIHADITHDRRLFFAMELLAGRDLQVISKDEPRLPVDRVLALLAQLLAGLGAAHDAGFVHADIKPANIFVTRRQDQERVVLLDFGLARLRPTGPAESAGGTPAFMAPEQLREGRVDARSDLFSVALVAVLLLTGWRRRSATELVPPLDGVDDASLGAVLARALSLDPDARYQTAAEFAAALATVPHAEASATAPVSTAAASATAMPRAAPQERPTGRRSRSRLIALALGLIAAGAAAGLAVVHLSARTTLVVPRLGRFALELRAFDWDEKKAQKVDVRLDELPNLSWQLAEPAGADSESPGALVKRALVVRGGTTVTPDELARLDHVEARGGKAFLILDGRGRRGEHCRPAVVPLRALPSASEGRDQTEPRYTIWVPTCQASAVGMIEIPPLPTQPASESAPEDRAPTHPAGVPAFRIDRTEVTNAAFGAFAKLFAVTGIRAPTYNSAALPAASGAKHPVTRLSWFDARAYCRYLGKELPTSAQWRQAMRDGAWLSESRSSSVAPARRMRWGIPVPDAPVSVNLSDTGPHAPARVGSHQGDRSPDGVVDLAGNVEEWVDVDPDVPARSLDRVTRGGNWADTKAEDLAQVLATKHPHAANALSYTIGVRCVVPE